MGRFAPVLPSMLCALAAQPVCAQDAAPAPPEAPIHVIAHRGASAYAPENTLAAYRVADALGVEEVELDVQLSRDGVPVLFHDGTLDRKTDLGGRVGEHDAATLRGAEIGTWFDAEHPESEDRFAGTKLATFEELLQSFGERFYYHVEIKGRDEAIPARISELLHAHGLSGRATVTSFHADQLERMRRIDPLLRLCRLVAGDPDEAIEETARARYEQIAIRAADLTPERVARARALGLEVRAYGIRDDADVERALEAGATGMTVDWPDRVDLRGRAVSDPPAAR